MIVHAKKEWLPDLIGLWRRVYGDGQEEVEDFCDSLFREELAWCALEGDEPVSVIYGIPAALWLDSLGDRKQELLYLYAGATDPARRGKGYYTELLQQVRRECGLPILSPVEELIPYYRRIGFHLILEGDEEKEISIGEAVAEKLITAKNTTGKSAQTAFPGKAYAAGVDCVFQGGLPERRSGLPERRSRLPERRSGLPERSHGLSERLSGLPERPHGLLETLSAPEYKALRDRLLGRAGYVEWPQEYLDYAVRSAVRTGGAACRIEAGGEEHLLFSSRFGDCLKIQETTLPERKLAAAAGALREVFACRRMVRKAPPLMSAEPCWPGDPYFALAMEE